MKLGEREPAAGDAEVPQNLFLEAPPGLWWAGCNIFLLLRVRQRHRRRRKWIWWGDRRWVGRRMSQSRWKPLVLSPSLRPLTLPWPSSFTLFCTPMPSRPTEERHPCGSGAKGKFTSLLCIYYFPSSPSSSYSSSHSSSSSSFYISAWLWLSLSRFLKCCFFKVSPNNSALKLFSVPLFILKTVMHFLGLGFVSMANKGSCFFFFVFFFFFNEHVRKSLEPPVTSSRVSRPACSVRLKNRLNPMKM